MKKSLILAALTAAASLAVMPASAEQSSGKSIAFNTNFGINTGQAPGAMTASARDIGNNSYIGNVISIPVTDSVGDYSLATNVGATGMRLGLVGSQPRLSSMSRVGTFYGHRFGAGSHADGLQKAYLLGAPPRWRSVHDV